MKRQYYEIKQQHTDCLLFFRLGDFYEMFDEDAKTASRELELALTTRDRGKAEEDQTPMEKGQLLYEGKAKKVYATDDPNLVIVSYKDDATALNGKKKGTIAGKGVINNKVTNYLMREAEWVLLPRAAELVSKKLAEEKENGGFI